MNNPDRKTVFITGSSKGIGKASTLLFQKHGWNVAATMRNLDDALDLTDLNHVKCYKLDVTDSCALSDCIQAVLNDFGAIDVVVNNAGIYLTKPLESVSEEDINHIIGTNIIAMIHVLQAFIPYFRTKREGTIINLSSMAGRASFPYQAIYSGSKWTIEGICESLLYELKGLNIKIKIVEPGMVHTHLYDESKSLDLQQYPKAYADSFTKWHQYLMNQYKKGASPHQTAKVIYKAATDGRSKFRYTSGIDSKTAVLLKRLLPFAIFRKLMEILIF